MLPSPVDWITAGIPAVGSQTNSQVLLCPPASVILSTPFPRSPLSTLRSPLFLYSPPGWRFLLRSSPDAGCRRSQPGTIASAQKAFRRMVPSPAHPSSRGSVATHRKLDSRVLTRFPPCFSTHNPVPLEVHPPKMPSQRPFEAVLPECPCAARGSTLESHKISLDQGPT